MKTTLSFLFALTLVLICGCSGEQPLSPPDDPGSAAVVPGEKAVDVTGDIGNGNLYRLICPDNWNGDLMVYDHGYVFPDADPALPGGGGGDLTTFFDQLLAMGYAVAYTSYSSTGWAVDVATNDTRQLKGLFVANVGVPTRTFLVGSSMGGLVALKLAERNPQLYDGVLTLSGAIGGLDDSAQHIFDVRAVFDYFFPGAIPGSVLDVPEGLSYLQAGGLAQQAILANLPAAFEMAGVDQLNLQYNSVGELVAAIVWPVIFHAGAFQDMTDRIHGHMLYDNADIVFTGSSDDAALNAGIVRSTRTADGEAYARAFYEPTGNLSIPVLSLHATRDQIVQVFQPRGYAAKVAAAGKSDLYRAIEIDRFGHSTWTADEMLSAFAELVTWADGLETAASRPYDLAP